MTRQIFVNLPVKDLQRSVAFFTSLGFEFDPRYTDENATCMIVAEDIYVMLLVESFFQTFTRKPLCDAIKATEVLVCLACDSRTEVDEMLVKALDAGGILAHEAMEEDFMYGQSFEDLDGHIWELIYMEPA
ncbi:MAG: VOC family protein [Pseudomonadota bacterium]